MKENKIAQVKLKMQQMGISEIQKQRKTAKVTKHLQYLWAAETLRLIVCSFSNIIFISGRFN